VSRDPKVTESNHLVELSVDRARREFAGRLLQVVEQRKGSSIDRARQRLCPLSPRCRRNFTFDYRQCFALDSGSRVARQFTQAAATRDDDLVLVEQSACCREQVITENSRPYDVGQRADLYGSITRLEPVHTKMGDRPCLMLK
jgi:hypothetical protein